MFCACACACVRVRVHVRVCVCVCEVFCPFLELDRHVPSIALTNILHNNNDSFFTFWVDCFVKTQQ